MIDNMEFYSTAYIRKTVELDITFNVPYGEGYKEVGSKNSVPQRNQINSTSLIEPTNNKFRSSTFIPYKQYLRSVSRINGSYYMDVAYRLVAPPILNVSTTATKDSYVRQSRPTLNYGTSKTLVSGKLLEGEFRTYVGLAIPSELFDINSDIRSVNFQFNVTTESDEDVDVSIYEMSDAWSENDVTWYNNPTTNANPLKTVTCKTGFVSVDIKDLVIKYVSMGRRNLDFFIKCPQGVVYISSKESYETDLRPKITATYLNELWTGYVESSDNHSIARIRAVGNSNFSSRFNIYKNNLQRSKALVHDPTIRYSHVWINNPQIRSSAVLYRQRSVNSTVIIRRSDNSDIYSDVGKLTGMPGRTKIRPTKQLPSIVRIKDLEEINTDTQTAFINKPVMYSKVQTVRSENISSTAYIRNLMYTDFKSTTGITNSKIKGKVTVKQVIQTNSVAIIRSGYTIDVSGKASMTKNTIYSKTNIHEHLNISSLAWIRVKATNTLNSGSTVRGFSSSQKRSKVSVLGKWLVYSKALLTSPSQISSTAIIKSGYDNDIRSKLLVRQKSDRSSIVRINSVSNFVSSAIVRCNVDKDIPSKSGLSKFVEQRFTAQVFKCKSLNTTVIIRHSGVQSVMGSAFIRESNVSEIHSKTRISGGYKSSSNYSTVHIRFTNSMDYYSKATIRNLARHWIPYVHAPEVFQDFPRKLPRYWKREEFIKE